MSEQIAGAVDDQGCIMIPSEIQDLLGLSPGMTLRVEARGEGQLCLRVLKEFPELVEKQGVLVVTSKADDNLTKALEHEREQRLSELSRRTGL
jgi:AbrB family looped-hinge helix DNA binding protein